jgi:hypothetical protein
MAGSAPTNSAAVDFEKQQAAEADAKEAKRQADLQQGQTLIDQIFNGAPVMGTKTQNFDWSTFKPQVNQQMATWISQNPTDPSAASASPISGANLPPGYTAVQTGGSTGFGGLPLTKAAAPATFGGLPATKAPAPATFGGLPASTSATSGWAIKGPDGKIYNPGDPLSYDTQYDTGQKTGGFDDAFYNSYRQKVLDYYQPDEERQYSQAKRDLTYNLARAGTLQSSAAADKQGELAYNDALQKANIVANANAQTGNLQNQIQANKESLINQLYATNDPTLTANLAESSAAATRLQDPMLTPAASLFTPALTTAGSVLSYATSPYGQYNPNASAPTSPAPAPSNASSGKTIPYS